MSKGSRRRPCFVSEEELDRRWAAINQASAAVDRSQPEEEQEPEEGWPDGYLPGTDGL